MKRNPTVLAGHFPMKSAVILIALQTQYESNVATQTPAAAVTS